MADSTFIETYFFYCNERCIIEGLISELEKCDYFPIEIENIKNFSNFPVDRAAFSLIALTETAEEETIREACKQLFEEGKIKSPYILIADPALKPKLSIYFNESDQNLLYIPFSINKLRELIDQRKKELQPFQCNLTIPKFELKLNDVQIGKYASDGTIIYEDKNIREIFNAFISTKSISKQAFSEMIQTLFHRKQQLINKVRINSKTYLLYILPLPSNNAINFTIMNY